MYQQRRSHIVCSPASPTDTDDADEAGYLRREQARFRFYKKIEDQQAESFEQHTKRNELPEMAAGESSRDG